jgi:hypothetical protein
MTRHRLQPNSARRPMFRCTPFTCDIEAAVQSFLPAPQHRNERNSNLSGSGRCVLRRQSECDQVERDKKARVTALCPSPVATAPTLTRALEPSFGRYWQGSLRHPQSGVSRRDHRQRDRRQIGERLLHLGHPANVVAGPWDRLPIDKRPVFDDGERLSPGHASPMVVAAGGMCW